MNLFRRAIFVLAGAVALVCLPLSAQPAPGGNAAAPVKSPVALFRELLAMSPAQRKDAIAIRPPDIQQRILEKLNEYEILPPALRDLRLRETELRWYLRPLMDAPRTNRAALLARISEPERKLVEERLRLWDLLPPPFQEQLKDNDMIASYFAQVGTDTPQQRDYLLRSMPADQREHLEQGFDRWKQMSEEQRQKTLAGFNNFFQMTPEEKEKTLDTLPEDERQKMERTLSSYANLTQSQRAQCIQSFEKFARMSLAERQQFLKNAERWREMTPEERQKWREIVTVAPIMPPTFPPPPPSPSQSQLLNAPAVATN